jgi:hypothetical protein
MFNPLSDFENINEDPNSLPLYVTKQEPNVINKKAIFVASLGLFCFVITTTGIFKFLQNISVVSQPNQSQMYDNYFVSGNGQYRDEDFYTLVKNK